MAVTRTPKDLKSFDEDEKGGLVPSPAVAGPNGDFRSDDEKQADVAKLDDADAWIGDDRPQALTADGLAAAVNAANEKADADRKAAAKPASPKMPTDNEKVGKVVRDWAYEFAPEGKASWMATDGGATIKVRLVTEHGTSDGEAPVAGWSDAQVTQALDSMRRDQLMV